MASGMLFAANDKLSGYDRIALATSSPPVHTGKMNHKHNKADMKNGANMQNSAMENKTSENQDRVIVNKTTIVGMVPVGK
jgi:pyruvate kinase